MGKRHLSRQELITACKQVARERRMAEVSPWTAMSIICGYTMLQAKDFKGKRIHNVSKAVDEYERRWLLGEIDLSAMSRKLIDDYAGFSVEYVPYTEADIRYKKGTFDYWLDAKQIPAQNTINEFATRYLIFWFTSLAEMYGYREKRLTDIYEEFKKHMELYKVDKVSIRDWQKALLDDAGIWFALPEDPLDGSKGSIMTGA